MAETETNAGPSGRHHHGSLATDGDTPPASARSRRRGGVRLRVTLAATLLCAVGLAGASFLLVRSIHDHLAGEIERTNQEQLDRLARQLENGPRGPLRLPGGGPGGPPLISATGPGADRLGLPPSGNGLPGIIGPLVEARRTVETRVGEVTLTAQRSLGEVERSVDTVTDGLLIGGPLLIALIAALAWFITGRALRPVEAIRAEAAAITGSTIHRRVPEPGSRDEVGRLAATMNEMLDRLEQTSIRQRQFVSDASHELRSPVAAIQAQVEVALRRGDAANWPEVASEVLAENARLETTVAELLELARLDESAELQRREVDLDEIVLGEAARLGDGIPIDTRHVSAGRVLGDARQLDRVARNLLDNARRHARSQVVVTLLTTGGHVELVVDDDGPGIATVDRARVFDRFLRLDEGRARDGGGLGLGLAMVKAIVDRHGGTVRVDDTPDGGARFVVRIPAAADQTA